MTVGRQPVVARLTAAQALRLERMGEALWPTEKLSAAEVTRRLALTELLWAESERNILEQVPSRRAPSKKKGRASKLRRRPLDPSVVLPAPRDRMAPYRQQSSWPDAHERDSYLR